MSPHSEAEIERVGVGEPDRTQAPLREWPGRACPACGRRFPPATVETRSVARCPHDGMALVRAADLADCDGDPWLGKTVDGRFVVLARIGSGSMGAVYRARQEAIGRDVALKILRPDRAYDDEAKARFGREARANSLLVSPHTVTVFDFGEAEGGAHFLAMELLEGETLGQRLRQKGRLPVADAVQIARETLVSLAEAHDKGIVHRDLKPDNLFLARVPKGAEGESGEVVKVLDFGIAKMVGRDRQVDALETQAGTVFGTPRYMSPEQAQAKPLDGRSDLYSLGVILYQMLVGRAPFADEDAVVVMARHIKSPPRPPSELAPDARIPPALESVVLRVLAKDPDDRPDSAQAFAAMLDRAMAEAPRRSLAPRNVISAAIPVVRGGDDPLVTDQRGTAPRRAAWLGAAIGAVVVAAIVLGGSRRERPAAEAPAPIATASPRTLDVPATPTAPAPTRAAAPTPSIDSRGAPSASSVAAPSSAPALASASRPAAPIHRADPRPLARPQPTAAPAATASGSRYQRFE